MRIFPYNFEIDYRFGNVYMPFLPDCWSEFLFFISNKHNLRYHLEYYLYTHLFSAINIYPLALLVAHILSLYLRNFALSTPASFSNILNTTGISPLVCIETPTDLMGSTYTSLHLWTPFASPASIISCTLPVSKVFICSKIPTNFVYSIYSITLPPTSLVY